MTEPMYQCSVCTRNKYNGDKSCPLNLDGGNSDIFDGMNRVINSCGCGAFIDTRARGPVVAQQAPAAVPQLPEDEIFFDVTLDPAGYRIYINFYNAGTFSIELSKEQLMRLQRQIKNLLPSDDAALIAQERERAKAPSGQSCSLNGNDGCDSCTRQPYFICSERVRIDGATIAAQAREEGNLWQYRLSNHPMRDPNGV